MADLVEQGCKSIESNLRDFADDEFGAPGIKNTIARVAVGKIADHVRDHQQDCLDAFFYFTDIASTPVSCDDQDNGVNYSMLLESGQWTFDPDGVVNNVEVSVGLATWAGVHPTDQLPQECESADENDRVLFLEIDPDPGSKIVTMVAGDAELHGPSLDGNTIEGSGVLGSTATGCEIGACSTIAFVVDPLAGAASLENLEIRSASAAQVGTPNEAMTIDDFRVQLWDRTPAALDEDGDTMTIPPGGAWFAVSAAAEGAIGVVAATNATEVVIARDADAWSTSAFTIAFQDGFGEHWALVIMPARWQ